MSDIDINVVKVEPKFNLNVNVQRRRVGIYNKGKNNKFMNNKISGFDIGIQDEGEETVAENNELI